MDIQQIERTLKASRAELTGKLSRDDIAVERLPDVMDDVQHTVERELAISSLNQSWKRLRDIDQALERLATGTYGECAECAEEISERRLKALPWATLCIRCQEHADSTGSNGNNGMAYELGEGRLRDWEGQSASLSLS